MRFNRKKAVARLAALVVAVMFIIAVPVRAYQGSIGGSPYAADLLVSGLNTGALDPGQEYWYAYSRLDLGDSAYDSIILSLNYDADGSAVANRVNFQVFTFNQVDAWLRDNSGPIDSLGLGTPASADFHVETGERLWAGPVSPSDVYYVRIFNLSPTPIQFRLTALGQKTSSAVAGSLSDKNSAPNEAAVIPAAMNMPRNATNTAMAAPDRPANSGLAADQTNDEAVASTNWLLAAQAVNGLAPLEAAAWLTSAAMLGWFADEGGVAAPNTAPAAAPAAVPVNPNPAAAVAIDAGDDGAQPETAPAVPLKPDPKKGHSIYPNQPVTLLYGPNTGRLAPKSEHWYTFKHGKLDEKLIEDFSLTMFFTPGEPNLARHVIFELFTGSQFDIWDRGTPDDMEHFGAGSWVSRDGDYITGERLWHGTVVDGDQYFIKIKNGTSKWVDYHLIPDDVINTELGAPKAKSVKPAGTQALSTGKDIGSPISLIKGRKSGKLAAGDDLWLEFETPIPQGDTFDFIPYLVELTHRPGIGSIANGVNVEIYPFQEQQIWRRGDGDQITPLGVGGYTEYDRFNDSHTWVWDGNLVSHTVYFFRIKNRSPQEIDYDLRIRRQ